MSNIIKAYACTDNKSEYAEQEFDLGELKDDEVEMDVINCGICHSDYSMQKNEWGMTQYPFVGGHECIGKVARVGKSVTHLKEGQVVGVGWQCGYCKDCTTCLSGDHNLCSAASGTITDGHKGGFADKMRAQATACILIPEGVDPSTAGPLLCAGITVWNPLFNRNIKPTSKVAIIGIGGLGHLAVQFASKWGCEVTAFTSSDKKIQEAKELGAHKTLSSRDPEALKTVQGYFDLIICTVNVSLDWNAYIGTLAPKGHLHLVGAVLEPLAIAVFPLLMGDKTIGASPVGSPAAIAAMLDFCARHKIAPVCEKFPMKDINTAMKKMEKGDVHYRLVLER
jgi:uncharacterized zinc-type alcohol dehydrogenase-like protein